ncbi:MAG: hypothetical protein ABIZ34_06870 [Candidatus Limnocylindrales bacterium]
MMQPVGEMGERKSATAVDLILYLLGVVGLAACLTTIWLAMRAVMDIGGACADGGPYVSARSCPNGVPLLMLASIFGLFLFGGLMVAKGSSLGGRWAGLVFLAWPALFLSLGWNFLEYSVKSRGGIEFGWLIPGVIFMVMGGGPLLGTLGLRGSGGTSTPKRLRHRRRDIEDAPDGVGTAIFGHATAAVTSDDMSDVASAEAGTDLASGLERLAKLHADGELDDSQYDAAKQALIAAVAGGR